MAHSNGNPVIFNPKQYDHIKEIATDLFENGRVDVLKPNVIEFAQFLKYAKILYGDERAKAKELKEEVKENKFIQSIEMAKALMHKYQYRLRSMFITFSEHGLLAVTPKHATFIPAPKIRLECSSGAGDSGIASLIVEAREKGFALRDNLSLDSLEQLGLAFVIEASATAILPGNTIASREQGISLQANHQIRPIPIK